MPEFFDILWDDEPGGNVDHLAEHDVSWQEADWVLRKYFRTRQRSLSRADRWVVRGVTAAGRHLLVVFDHMEDLNLVLPITAYEPEPGF